MKPENTLNLVANFKVPHSELDEIPASERDSAPMTAEQLANARRVPRVTTLRRALRMTQEQFAAEFHIPIGTLRDWEQGRTAPDAPARAYLRAIAGNAEAVSKALITYRTGAAAE